MMLEFVVEACRCSIAKFKSSSVIAQIAEHVSFHLTSSSMHRMESFPSISAMPVDAQALAITAAIESDESIHSDNSAQSDDSVGNSNAPFATSYDA